MAHSSGGRLAGRPVGGWTSHRKNAPFLYFHTTRDTTLRTVARRSARWPRRAEEHCLGICVRGTTAFPTVKAVAESSAPTRLVLPVAIQSPVLTSLQQRLFRTGGRLIRHARYFTLQLAESYLTGNLFRQILQRIERLAWHPT